MNILGLSCYYHDSAAVLIRDGAIVAAAQEERFTRIKHDSSFPRHAVAYCLREGQCDIDTVDLVVFYDKPFLKFERILDTYLSEAPKGLFSALKAIPVWIKQKIWIEDAIRNALNYQGKILFPEHHLSHAASAFFPSPFDDAAILTVDGVGEWATASIAAGRGNSIEILQELHFPHSLGLLYSAFTYQTGFKVNSGEYKLMGLAPYGNPIYKDVILNEVMDLKEDGSFRLDLSYFRYTTGLTMTSPRFDQKFGGPPRNPSTPVSQREMDLAASVQQATEEIVGRMARHAVALAGSQNLCLAGGVALNCVANGHLQRRHPDWNVWVQPAAGDAGGALGAALAGWHIYTQKARKADSKDSMKGSFLGPSYSNRAVRAWLEERNLPFTELSDDDLFAFTAALLADGKITGWFQGRMEFGPRALGNRSILADPRNPDMQKRLNLSIKYRESFRPFAPAVLSDYTDQYFEGVKENPYMLFTAPVAQQRRKPVKEKRREGLELLYQLRSDIPAVTHVDYSARVQTVDQLRNPRFYQLIDAFRQKTGCAVLVNTSFNVRGEPPVQSPADAWACFMATEMDYLVMGNCVLYKKDQPEEARLSLPDRNFSPD